MTLVVGNKEQQAWLQNSSGPAYYTSLSLNSQPAFWSLNGWPGEATCFSMVMEKRIPQFTTKLQNVGGKSGLAFEKYCSAASQTLLERYLKATRIGEEGEGIKLAAGAQFRVVTSPAFSPNTNKQFPKGAL